MSEYALDILLASGPCDHEHPLLRFAEHHLVGRHPFSAARHGVEVNAHPDTTLRRDLAHGAGEPGSAEILQRLDDVLLDELERRFHQQLLEERVAHLDRRALVLASLAEFKGREQRCAGDPISPGVGSDEVDRAPGTRRVGEAELVPLHEPDAHRIHERVPHIAGLKGDVPGDVGDPDAVAIRANAADDATHETAGAQLVRHPEEERIQQRDRPSAHREHIAEDPAHARGRALIRLDRGGVVVALHLERAQEPVTQIHRAGVLAGSDGDARTRRRQRAQELLRMLVGAVLAPHRAEHRPLEMIRFATDELADARSLEGCQSHLGGDVQLRLRRHRPRHHRGRTHASSPAPTNRSS